MGSGTGGLVLKGVLLAHRLWAVTTRKGAITQALPRLGFTRVAAVIPIESPTIVNMPGFCFCECFALCSLLCFLIADCRSCLEFV